MSDSNVLHLESTVSASTRTPVVKPSNRLPSTAFKSRNRKQSSHEGKTTVQNRNSPSSYQQLLLNSAKKRLGRADSNVLKLLERRPIGSGAKRKKNIESGVASAKKSNIKPTSSDGLPESHPPKLKHSKSPPKCTANSDGNFLTSRKPQALSSKDGGHSLTAPLCKKRTLPIAIQPPIQGIPNEHTAISPAEVVKSVYGKGVVDSKYKIPSKRRRSSDSPLSPTSKYNESPSCNGTIQTTSSQNNQNEMKSKTPKVDSVVKVDSFETGIDDVFTCSPPSASKLHVIKESQQLKQSSDSLQQTGKHISAETPSIARRRQFARKSTGGNRHYKSHTHSLVQYEPLAVGNKQWVLKRYSRLRLRKLPCTQRTKIETQLQGFLLDVKTVETAAPVIPDRKRALQPSVPEIPSKRPKTDQVSCVAEQNDMTDTSESELPSTCSRTVPFEDVIPLKCARVTPYTPRGSGKRTHLLSRVVNTLAISNKAQNLFPNGPARISAQVPEGLEIPRDINQSSTQSSSDYVMCESSDDTAILSVSASVSDSMDGLLSDFISTKMDNRIALHLESTSFSDLSSDEPSRGTANLRRDTPPPAVKNSVSVTTKPHQNSSSNVTPSIDSPLSTTCTTSRRSGTDSSISHSSDNQTSVSRPATYSFKSLGCSTNQPPGRLQYSVGNQYKLNEKIGDNVNHLSANDTKDERTLCVSEKAVSLLPKTNIQPNMSSAESQTELSHEVTTNPLDQCTTNTKRRLPLQLQTPKPSTATPKGQDLSHSPILSPADEEYSLRLQETIDKFVYGEVADPKSSRSPRAVTPAPPPSDECVSDDEEDLSLVVKIKCTDVCHFPSLTTQHMGLTTETLGTYQSQGVQVDRGMIVDKEILDKYVSVKISEALYEMNEQLQKTEALVEQVMADKEKLEKLLQLKVQMIRDLTVTGFKPVLVDAETMTNDSHLQKQSATVSGRAKIKNASVQTHIKGTTNICLKHLDVTDLQPYLRMRSATPLSTTPEPDEIELINNESIAQETKKQWMFKESEACSRCTAIRPQVRLMRALSNSVNSNEDKTLSAQEDLVQQVSGTVIEDTVCWDMLGSTLQKRFEGVHSVYIILKNLSVETVLKRSASEVVSSLGHLLSHLPIPNSFVQTVQQGTQSCMSESTASYLLGWKMKELIILLKEILENGAVLPAFFTAELIQTQKIVHKTLNFASEGLRNETILHGSHGYMVDSNYSSLPLRSHELPPLPMEPFFFYNFDDLDIDPYGSETSYSSLTSSDSEADERPLTTSTSRVSQQEPKKKSAKIKRKSTNTIRVRRHTDPTMPSRSLRKRQSKNDKRPRPLLKWLQRDKLSAEHVTKRPSKDTGPKKSRIPSTCARVSPDMCTSKRKGTNPNILCRPVSASSTKSIISLASKEVSSVSANVCSSATENLITNIQYSGERPDTTLPVATTLISNPTTITSNSVASASTLATVSNTLSSSGPYQIPTVQQAILNPALLSSQFPQIHSLVQGITTPLPTSKNIAISGRLPQNEVSHQQFVNDTQLLQNKSKLVSASNALSAHPGVSALPVYTTGISGQTPILNPGVNSNLIMALMAQTKGYLQRAHRQRSMSGGSPTTVEIPAANKIKTVARSQNSASKVTETTPTIQQKHFADGTPVQVDTPPLKDAPTSATFIPLNSAHKATVTSKTTVISQRESVSPAEVKPLDVTSTPIAHSKTTIWQVCPTTTVAATPTTISVVINPNKATPVPSCGSKTVNTAVIVSTSAPTVTAVSGKSKKMSCKSNAVTKSVSCVDTVSSTRTMPSSSSITQVLQNKCITPEFMRKLASALSTISRSSKGSEASSQAKPVTAGASTALPGVSPTLSQSKTVTDARVTSTKPRMSPSLLQPVTTGASTALPSVSTSLSQSKPITNTSVTSTKPPMSPSLLQPVTTVASTRVLHSSAGSLQQTTSLTTTTCTTATQIQPVAKVCTALLPTWTSASCQQTRPVTVVTGTHTSTLSVSAVPPLAGAGANQVPPASGIQRRDVLPLVQVSHSSKGLVVKWTFPDKFLNMQHLVHSYELFASSADTVDKLQISRWAKVGSIDPLPLPMAVTMTNFTKGCYRFSVRALFVKGYCSGYSQPCVVNLS